MENIIQRLLGVCNWLIFLELLFGSITLYNIYPIIYGYSVGSENWLILAFYGTLLYLFITLKNKLNAFRYTIEPDLLKLEPTAIIPTKFRNILLALFGLQLLMALLMFVGHSSPTRLFQFYFVLKPRPILQLLYFVILPLGVIIQGTRLLILMTQLKRFKTSLAKIGNIGV